MVPGAGLEPARPRGQRILSPVRLPVSPPGHRDSVPDSPPHWKWPHEKARNRCGLSSGWRRNWRPGSELNRRTRLCRPLHNHSATRPVTCCADTDQTRASHARIQVSGKRRTDRHPGASRDPAFNTLGESWTCFCRNGGSEIIRPSPIYESPGKPGLSGNRFPHKRESSCGTWMYRRLCASAEPGANRGFAALGDEKVAAGNPIFFYKMERETRLELATPTLARSCSTN